MTPDDLVERVARKIAAHVGAEKFWGLYKDTAQDIVDIALKEAAEVERLRRQNDFLANDRDGYVQLLTDEGTCLKAEVERLRAALTLAVASDGGIAYSSEDDAVGYRVCCGGSSFNPHDDDCWVTVSRAALTPSQKPRT